MKPPQRKHFLSWFLSLRWKALILTSLVLVTITASYSAFNHRELTRQFELEREGIHKLQRQEVEGLIEQSLQTLEQAAVLIPKLAGMRSTLLASNQDQLKRIFNHHWEDLQTTLGLHFARFYDPDNRLLASWSREGLKQPDRNRIPRWVREANKSRKPLLALHCGQDCLRFAAVPLVVEKNYFGVLLLGSSMADIVQDFKQISGAQVGLLITDADEQDADQQDRQRQMLSGWAVKVTALTAPEEDIKLLRAISDLHPGLEELEAGFHIRLDQRVYEVNTIPLKGSTVSAKGFIVVITDITRSLREIAKSTRQNLIAGVSGIFLAEALLLALLWTPMTHLRRTADTLPLLAQGAFQQVRNSLSGARRRHMVRDEVDILDQTAIGLSNQLEELQRQVSDNTEALATRMRELTTERDFVRSLLDTAQVIVLTQSREGKILLVNRYGQALSGYSQTELVNQDFEEFIEMESVDRDVTGQLIEVGKGKRDLFRHESRLSCKDGTVREIAWLHSRLRAKSTQSAVVLSIGLDITERKQAEVRLSWLADHDPLSGLINRRRFQQELQRALAAAKRHNQEGALLFFDLDHFKFVNDASGHHAGDVLLKVIAHTLTKIVRDTDTVARLGGDEFGVMMERSDEAGAIEAAKKIIRHLGAINFPYKGRSHKISASVGIALFPAHGAEINDLLAVADLAMYQAKEAGRGTWHIFAPDDLGRERLHAHVFWKEQVEAALAEDRFVIHYQPILDLRTGAVGHYEALLRMIDRSGTLILPEDFISSCEHTGLIHAIDHMVLEKAITDARIMINHGLNCSLSINLSAMAFEDPELLTVLRRSLRRHDVKPGQLIFEITETAAVADFAAARGLMKSLRDLGCSFSLDDFGVGFASFYSLKQLPVDYVKIDGSFIHNLSRSRDDQIFVKAMSEVARGFGKKSIAEYVGSEAAKKILREYGVDYAQGFHLGKPVPLELLLDKPITDVYSVAQF
ncbi:MAG: EAL domain-containing protein [Gammaproteobacteria bacterium]